MDEIFTYTRLEFHLFYRGGLRGVSVSGVTDGDQRADDSTQGQGGIGLMRELRRDVERRKGCFL